MYGGIDLAAPVTNSNFIPAHGDFPTESPDRVGNDARFEPKQRGFTLVELLIVAIIIGMMASVAVIAMRTFLFRYQLDTEAQNLAAFLTSVPSMARQINAPVFLVWKAQDSTLVISRDSAGTQSLDEFRIDPRLTFTPPAITTLRCDVIGRVFSGNNATMITALQIFTLQHPLLSGKGIPAFQLRIPPLWAVMVDRV